MHGQFARDVMSGCWPVSGSSAGLFCWCGPPRAPCPTMPKHLGPAQQALCYFHLTSPAWEAGVDTESQPVGRAEQMRSWTAIETVRFLEGHDLAGPAELVRRSGVNGADLLQLSEQELCTDVLLAPLAARKVAAARDAFLSC